MKRVGCTHRQEHRGTVLAPNDPRAWAGTIAFGDGNTPTQEQVDAHLARLEELGTPLGSKVPVLWDFGKVYWERPETLFEEEA